MKLLQAGDYVLIDNIHLGYIVCFLEGDYTQPIVQLIEEPYLRQVDITNIEKVDAETINCLSVSKCSLVEVTKEFTFDSAHYLKNYIGKCANLHGHTYKLQVSFKGIPNPETGLLIDFKEVKSMVKEIFLDTVDHQVLNDHFEFNTTAENMVVYIFNLFVVVINELYENVKVSKVTLWETPTSFATYEGEVI